MKRRAFLTKSALIGCSLAASPLITPMSFAATPGDNRLVVIILRGGMDGMGAVAPYGDPGYAALRGVPRVGGKGAFKDLDGFYALHPGLRPLAPLWAKGELAMVQAVSTPYRDKRSHFDGQDLLEAGVAEDASGTVRDGWLNRMLAHLPGARNETAYAVGNDPLMVLDGNAPMTRWSPEADLALSPQALRLAEVVMGEDPAMAAALRDAFALADSDGDAVEVTGGRNEMLDMMRQDMQDARQADGTKTLASFAAGRLREDARIAAFSINGWDSHANQDRILGRALGSLSDAILTLREDLGGAVWDKTAVVAMTEFGRTAQFNGTKGTDHGTGGAMVLAGGAIRGGKVYGQWPGLAEADLYARRDLMPTGDVRAYAGWLMRGLFGLEASVIERDVFPGLTLGNDPKLIV